MTGLGVVSPVGIGTQTAWNNLVAGKSGITRISHFDPSEFSSQIAGEVKDFNAEDFISAKDARRMDKFIQFGLAAGIEAFKDSGIVVTEENAERIGVEIGSGIGGLGLIEATNDVYDDGGPRRSMVNALKNAGVNTDQVQFMNAHGTSTPLGDTNETNAIKATFGDHAYKLVVNSTKSMTGHLLGGAGGLESVFTVLSTYNQISPPTINIFNQDPECDLDYCANTARDMKIEYALKNNFGFGGTNGSLVFKKV